MSPDEYPVSTLSRSLPHSLEAEESLISLCLLDGVDVVGRCVSAGITPIHFYDSKHGICYEIIEDLFIRQRPIAIEVLAEELKVRRQLDAVGGYAFLSQVSGKIPTTAQTGYFIEKVLEQAALRRVIRTCTSAVEECYNYGGDINELMTTISDRVSKATGVADEKAEEPFQVVAAAVRNEVLTPKIERPKVRGEVSWGLVDIDHHCGKLQPGNLVVIAGMPSTGKSALADQVAWGAASTGAETLIFTFEMTKREKAIRMAQQISCLNHDHYDGAVREMQLRYTDALKMIEDCPNLHVYERDVSVNRVTARTRSFITKGKKVGLIVVDFLQYLSRLEPTIGRERTDEKIGRMTAALKLLARECECPAVLLSSCNRDGYKDGNRPTLASLRSSGEIESDADVVAILHWPKQTPEGDDQNPRDDSKGYFYVEFNQEKGRSKGVAQIGLTFERKATRFVNYCP